MASRYRLAGRTYHQTFAAHLRHPLYKSCALPLTSTTCVANAFTSLSIHVSVPFRLPSPISVTRSPSMQMMRCNT